MQELVSEMSVRPVRYVTEELVEQRCRDLERRELEL